MMIETTPLIFTAVCEGQHFLVSGQRSTVGPTLKPFEGEEVQILASQQTRLEIFLLEISLSVAARILSLKRKRANDRDGDTSSSKPKAEMNGDRS